VCHLFDVVQMGDPRRCLEGQRRRLQDFGDDRILRDLARVIGSLS